MDHGSPRQALSRRHCPSRVKRSSRHRRSRRPYGRPAVHGESSTDPCCIREDPSSASLLLATSFGLPAPGHLHERRGHTSGAIVLLVQPNPGARVEILSPGPRSHFLRMDPRAVRVDVVPGVVQMRPVLPLDDLRPILVLHGLTLRLVRHDDERGSFGDCSPSWWWHSGGTIFVSRAMGGRLSFLQTLSPAAPPLL